MTDRPISGGGQARRAALIRVFACVAITTVAGAAIIAALAPEAPAPEKSAAVVPDAPRLDAAIERNLDWANRKLDPDDPNIADYRQSQAICRAVAGREPPAADRTNGSEAQPASGCSSVALYYDLPRNRNPVLARQCALSNSRVDQRDEARLVLMNLYANGEGVRRDLDLAIRLACELWSSDAEMHARIMRLSQLRDRHWRGHDFDFCLDESGAFFGGPCADYYYGQNSGRRAIELRGLTEHWTPAEQLAFQELQRAENAYAWVHAEAVHGHASPAGWVWLEPVDEVDQLFVRQIRALSTGQVPDYSAQDIRATRRQLDSNYRASQRGRPDHVSSEPGPAQFREAERAWQRFRDAFIRLALLHDAGLERDRLATWLARTRPESARIY